MAKKPSIADMSTRLLVVALGSERRWRRVAIIGVVAAAALGAVVFVAARNAETAAAATLETDWSAFSACLIGAEPLPPGVGASTRVAHIQLGVLGTARDKRAKASEAPWPASCAPHAFAVAQAARSAGKDGEALAEAAQALGTALRDDANATRDLKAEVDKVYADPMVAKLKPVLVPNVAPPPAAATLLWSNDSFRQLPKLVPGSFGLSAVRGEPSSGSKIRFLVDQKDLEGGPVLCVSSATEASARCSKVSDAAAKQSPGLRLVGATEEKARPFYFAGDRGQLGVFPPDAKEKVAAVIALGATARADGSMLLLYRHETLHDVRVSFVPATGAPVERPLADFQTHPDVGLVREWVVSRGDGKTNPPHLFAKKLGEGGTPDPAAISDVGELPEGPTDKAAKDGLFQGCFTDDAAVVRVRGAVDAVAFYTAGRWSAPVKTGTRGGVLTCRGMEAVITDVTHAVEGDKNYGTVVQSRCNTTECKTTTLALKELFAGAPDVVPPDADSLAAADVGGKLLLVWNAGYLGGVRMRFAPADRIKATEDTVITDGREAGNKLSTFVEMRILPASDYALLFLSTTAGPRVLRVGSTGKLLPVQGAQ